MKDGGQAIPDASWFDAGGRSRHVVVLASRDDSACAKAVSSGGSMNPSTEPAALQSLATPHTRSGARQSVAQEHQFARTATHVEPGVEFVTAGRPPSVNAMRVAAALTGFWVDQPALGCRPNTGHHAEGCPHHERYLITHLREIARRAFDDDSGSSTNRVVDGLDELASNATRVMVFDPVTKKQIGRHVATAGEFRHLGSRVRWAWGASTHESLLAGHYTRYPEAIVQRLSGTAFLFWQAILSHPMLLWIKPGESRESTLTGRLSLERLGLDRANRPSKIRTAVAAAAAKGNALQSDLTVEVLDSADGGLKVRVRRNHQVRTSEDVGRVQPRTQVRMSEDAIVREIGPTVVFQTSIPVHKTEVTNASGDRSDTGSTGFLKDDRSLRSRTDVATGAAEDRANGIEALLGQGLDWHPNDEQHRLIAAIEDRGIKAGCDDHQAIVEDGISERRAAFEGRRRGQVVDTDPLFGLIEHDRLFHPRKPVRTRPDADARLAGLKPASRKAVLRLIGSGSPWAEAAAWVGLAYSEDEDGNVARLYDVA